MSDEVYPTQANFDYRRRLYSGSQNRGFTYLEVTIPEDGNVEGEIRRRITQANKAYFVLITTFKSRVIHSQTKICIYKTVI